MIWFAAMGEFRNPCGSSVPPRLLGLVLLLAAACFAPQADARLWTDSSGRYTLEANLVAANDTSVVLQRADHELVSIPLDKLSEADRAYVGSPAATDLARQSIDGRQTWTLRDGTQISGRLVDYMQGDMTIRRRRGRIYVNDRPLANLPEFYQLLVPKIVAHFEKAPSGDRQSLEAWLARQPGQRRTFALEGVVLETDSGDEYSVPFFLFSDDEQSLLRSGYDAWLAARKGNDFGAQDDESFRLQALAAAHRRDRQVQHQIGHLQLQLQAVQAGLPSLWEVTLFPAAGRGGRPQWVVMPGRDSRQATAAALQQFPGYVAGPVRRVAG
jgi:SLA1 homology domain 1, SHD1